MKKFLAFLLAAIVSIGCFGMLASCSVKPIEEGQKIIVGVTNYKPMDYEENGEWVGFDAELAKKTFSELGHEIEFRKIDWNYKIVDLKAQKIDCIWNGMTVTDELKANILLSNVYLTNQQYGVVKVENKDAYKSKEDLAGKKVSVEIGSAAQDAVADLGCSVDKLATQNAAVLGVSAGTNDIAIVDFTMAQTLTAEGSDYYGKLVMVDLGFEIENFAIGFRTVDTALCEAVNEKIANYYEDGTISALAEKYGVQNLLVK